MVFEFLQVVLQYLLLQVVLQYLLLQVVLQYSLLQVVLQYLLLLVLVLPNSLLQEVLPLQHRVSHPWVEMAVRVHFSIEVRRRRFSEELNLMCGH
jgi:hypothetical protein